MTIFVKSTVQDVEQNTMFITLFILTKHKSIILQSSSTDIQHFHKEIFCKNANFSNGFKLTNG